MFFIIHKFTQKTNKVNPNHCDSVQYSRSVVSYSLPPHEPQHARPPCPSPAPRVHPNSRPSSRWCHPTISSSIVPFSSHLQSFPASGSCPTSQLSASGGQSTGVSAPPSVLPMNTQDRSPLGWTGWISLQSKGLSRVFFLVLKYFQAFITWVRNNTVMYSMLPDINHWDLYHASCLPFYFVINSPCIKV